MNCPSCGAFITHGASHCLECKRPVIKVAENGEQSSKPGGNQTIIPGQGRRRLRQQKAAQGNIKSSTSPDEAPTLLIENLAKHLSSSASAPAAPFDEVPTLPIVGLLNQKNAPTRLLPDAQNIIPTRLLPEDAQNTTPIEYPLDVQYDASTEDLSGVQHYAPTEDLSDAQLSPAAEGQSPYTDTPDYSLDASDMPTRPVTALPAPKQPGNKRQGGLPVPPATVTVVSLCLIILLVGGVAIGAIILKGTVVTLPPSVLDGSPAPIEGPSGQVIDPTAGAIISNVNLASKISNNHLPMVVTTTFVPKQRVYLTFVVKSQNQVGYTMVKWYANNLFLAGNQMAHNPQDNVVFFSYVYGQPTHATAELYWCSNTSCSDARLAHIVSFTVQ